MQETLDLSFNIKSSVRTVELSKNTTIKIGGNSSLSFMTENQNLARCLVALEFLYSSKDIFEKVETEKDADIIAITFDISEDLTEEKFDEIQLFLKKLDNATEKPLILRGVNNNEIDKKLIPFIAQNAPKESIIAFADENTYEQIVPDVAKNNHVLVLRSPIDINLAKELNILAIDKGMSPDKILIDPDTGGLGYGLDYGYSIVEKIRLAAFDGDEMLNMPIIIFIGEESYRAKEAKSDTFDKNWGNFENRSAMWEISGAVSMISAGANIVVLQNPKSVKAIKGLI